MDIKAEVDCMERGTSEMDKLLQLSIDSMTWYQSVLSAIRQLRFEYGISEDHVIYAIQKVEKMVETYCWVLKVYCESHFMKTMVSKPTQERSVLDEHIRNRIIHSIYDLHKYTELLHKIVEYVNQYNSLSLLLRKASVVDSRQTSVHDRRYRDLELMPSNLDGDDLKDNLFFDHGVLMQIVLKVRSSNGPSAKLLKQLRALNKNAGELMETVLVEIYKHEDERVFKPTFLDNAGNSRSITNASRGKAHAITKR